MIYSDRLQVYFTQQGGRFELCVLFSLFFICLHDKRHCRAGAPVSTQLGDIDTKFQSSIFKILILATIYEGYCLHVCTSSTRQNPVCPMSPVTCEPRYNISRYIHKYLKPATITTLKLTYFNFRPYHCSSFSHTPDSLQTLLCSDHNSFLVGLFLPSLTVHNLHLYPCRKSTATH